MFTIYFKIPLLLILLLLFTGCSIKQTTEDISLVNQDIQNYSHNFTTLPKKITQNLYEEHFKPWNQIEISSSKKEALWGLEYTKKEMYGLNYRKIDSFWFEKQISNANFEEFNKKNLRAITVKNTNLRVFPTSLPMFYNPVKKTEGFPFDYNQNSGIKINTPILVSHFSKDRAWAYVESSFASGFIKTSSFALVDEEIVDAFKNSTLFIAVKDNFAVYKNSIFKESIKLGTVFPKSKQGNFFVVNSYHNLKGYLQTVKVPKNAVVEGSLAINEENITNIINELINEPYGWGEALFKRDCSALTKDYFSTFGLFLSRNSAQQLKNGNYISLEKLNAKEKKEFIVKNAKPFFTLIYLKGHIMLYIGVLNQNEPLVFHNIWSVKSKKLFKQEQHIIGKAVISTLEVGKELDGFYKKNSLLHRVKGIVIIE